MGSLRRASTSLFSLLALTVATVGFAAAAHGAATYPPSTGSSGGGVSVTVSNDTPAPGSSDTVTGTGFEGGETVSVDLHTAVVHLGDAVADSSGHVSLTFTIPTNLSGTHTIVLTGLKSGLVGSVSITIATATSSGGLAFTGAAVIGLTTLAVILLVGGASMLIMGRRRTGSRA